MDSNEKLAGRLSIIVNGETRELSGALTVSQLLETLDLPQGRVAIERNLQILPRAEWATTEVVSGDRYEIVQFVGGG